jgi:hypothetical protein
LVIADEAHRCAGRKESIFATVLDGHALPSRYRLFMTATPRYFSEIARSVADSYDVELVSMDDQDSFGPVFHNLTFADAVQRELLPDYRVVVTAVSNSDIKRLIRQRRLVRTKDGLETDAETLAARVGLARAIEHFRLRKTISFHSSILRAKRFIDPNIPDSLPNVLAHLPADLRPKGTPWLRHISGRIPAGQRESLLQELRKLDHDTWGLVTNCACLGEGIDVPALDGVAFIDPKRSTIAIIQAVGRAMRRAKDKTLGRIVIPVFVDETEDPEKALASSTFDPVWQVVKALRAHDQRLAEKLDQLRLHLSQPTSKPRRATLPKGFAIDLPETLPPDFFRALSVRLVEQTTRRVTLTEDLILRWADYHKDKTGYWPNQDTGPVLGVEGETWKLINASLFVGQRGLPGGSSLARLLALHRGIRNRLAPPALAEDNILRWADQYFAKEQRWPLHNSGPIPQAPGDTWHAVDYSLRRGTRGLPGGSSLARFLLEKRGARKGLPDLTVESVIEWMKTHHARTGHWPSADAGDVQGAPGETWKGIDAALRMGRRGLPRGSSLAFLKQRLTKKPHPMRQANLTVTKILKWVDKHYALKDEWPKKNSGKIIGTRNERWDKVDQNLYKGERGLPGGQTLARLLAEHRGVRHRHDRTPLSEEMILTWADDHFDRTGHWPTAESGKVLAAVEFTWQAIALILYRGQRGLQPTSLARLLVERRGIRRKRHLSPLSEDQIINWADQHFAKKGRWPSSKSGPVLDAPGETWQDINKALRVGNRGLHGHSSLSQLLVARGRRKPRSH